MTRIDFIKRLVLGAATLFMVPKIVAQGVEKSKKFKLKYIDGIPLHKEVNFDESYEKHMKGLHDHIMNDNT